MGIELITLGEIAFAVAFLVGLISGIATIRKTLEKLLENLLKGKLDSIKGDISAVKEELSKEISSVNKNLETVDRETCKNFLVRFLADVEQGKPIDEIEKERFCEQFEHYKNIGGNSYICEKVEKLKAKNLL